MNKVQCAVCGRELEVESVRATVSYACSTHVAPTVPIERAKAMSVLCRTHKLSALSLVSVSEPEPEPEAGP